MLVVDEDIAPLFFVFVAGDFGASQKLRGVFFVRLIRFEKSHPILVNQDQNGVGNFSRKCLITFHVLDAVKDFRIRQVLPFMDECLTNLIGGLIVQVLGSKRGSIERGIARITLADQMLLDEFHRFPPV